MAEPENAPEAVEKKSGSARGLIALAVVAVISGAVGFAVPRILFGKSSPQAADQQPLSVKPAFVPFGETVVNIDEGRLNRYLRMSITLQVNEDKVAELTQKVEKRRAILKSWLLSYLSDRTMDEIRGAAGQNRLRREILENFNAVLSDDSSEVIHDVLFEEFNIQ